MPTIQAVLNKTRSNGVRISLGTEAIYLCCCGTPNQFNVTSAPRGMTCSGCGDSFGPYTGSALDSMTYSDVDGHILEWVEVKPESAGLRADLYQSPAIPIERHIREGNLAFLTQDLPLIGSLHLSADGNLTASGVVDLSLETLRLTGGAFTHQHLSSLTKEQSNELQSSFTTYDWATLKKEGWSAWTAPLVPFLTPSQQRNRTPHSGTTGLLTGLHLSPSQTMPKPEESVIASLAAAYLSRYQYASRVNISPWAFVFSAFVGTTELIGRYPQMEQVYKSGFETLSTYWVNELSWMPTKKFKLNIYFKEETSLAKIMPLPSFVRQDLKKANFETYKTILKIHELSPIGDIPYALYKQMSDVLDLKRFHRCIREGAGSFNDILMYLRRCYLNQALDYAEALVLWDDYLMMARRTGLPYKQYPSLLKMEHDLMVRDSGRIKNQAITEAFNKRADLLGSLYEFEDASTGFGLFVPATQEDLLKEGRVLRHCVGAYDYRIAKGETIILFLRKLSDKETPLYTIEWCDETNRVLQAKGKGNVEVKDRNALACLTHFEQHQKALATAAISAA